MLLKTFYFVLFGKIEKFGIGNGFENERNWGIEINYGLIVSVKLFQQNIKNKFKLKTILIILK